MTAEQFEAHVSDHAKSDLDFNYAVVALNGEAGEVAEWHKKVNLRGNVVGMTPQDLKEELGDVLWYLTRLTNLMGWSLAEIMDINKVKLDARRAKNFKQVV